MTRLFDGLPVLVRMTQRQHLAPGTTAEGQQSQPRLAGLGVER